MAIINRETLMAKVVDTKPVVFNVPEWGGDILIERSKAIKTAEYFERIKNVDKHDNPSEFYIDLIMAFVVDEKGDFFFHESDREWLGNQSVGVINRIGQKIFEVEGFTKDTQEEAEKNLEKAES